LDRYHISKPENAHMPSIKLKIPPPVQGLICLFFIWCLTTYLPIWEINIPFQTPIAIAMAVVGFSIDISGLIAFRKAQTTINPLKPQNASSLVITGIYHISRNPMYLGMLIILLGAVLYFGNISGFLAVPIFVFTINELQIKSEEKTLTELFGDPYRQYLAKVRRWI